MESTDSVTFLGNPCLLYFPVNLRWLHHFGHAFQTWYKFSEDSTVVIFCNLCEGNLIYTKMNLLLVWGCLQSLKYLSPLFCRSYADEITSPLAPPQAHTYTHSSSFRWDNFFFCTVGRSVEWPHYLPASTDGWTVNSSCHRRIAFQYSAIVCGKYTFFGWDSWGHHRLLT